MNNAPLKAAVIGCGFFARNHLLGWNDIEDVTVAAVCDRDRAKAEAAAALFAKRPAIYTDAAQMLAAEPLDFLDVVTTMETHRELMALAAKHKLPAICQKPFAPEIETARAIVATAREAGTPIMVHENFRFQAPLLGLKAAIDEGAVGKPFFAHIEFRTGYDIIAGQPYLAEVERFIILDLGIHVLDVARFLMGEAERLYCRTNQIMPNIKGEDAAFMVLDHEAGSVSHVRCSYTTRVHPDPFPETLVTVEGDKGTLRLTPGYRLELHTRQGMTVRDVPPTPPAWADPAWALLQESVVNTQRHWVRSLRSGRPADTSGEDNLRTFALVEAAYESAASGQPVEPRA
ncbi:Gfo/Idh/MocA family protein [Marinivivus vitaminiproducens]|uniref:Gfo/Idh/MocA family protein n=1 Tax=Marinivivus vitaminiproducens TaxID=3035935 RepID=UPI0027A16587|nr:Gfo/Idh/MocA family oxidoreductase [Geminicoccaceae bacterium SCSIO 64248]